MRASGACRAREVQWALAAPLFDVAESLKVGESHQSPSLSLFLLSHYVSIKLTERTVEKRRPEKAD